MVCGGSRVIDRYAHCPVKVFITSRPCCRVAGNSDGFQMNITGMGGILSACGTTEIFRSFHENLCILFQYLMHLIMLDTADF